MFAAENIRTGRPVAIKLLRQDSKTKSSAVARFRQEARAAGSINSDHVTQVLDVEEDPEHGVVLVFELLEGESLIDRLKRTGPIPFEELHPIIEQVWIGLADAHRVGIIHRDLKPSNVFLERRPDGIIRVKILDFGISKVPKEVGGETLTEMGQSLGTFSFMPPEQIGKAKTVDHRADIYAGATLIFQSLTGQLPYAARNILLMVEMKNKEDARKLSAVMSGPLDPRLEAFVARGLARDANLRFQTALEALAAWRELRPVPSSGSSQTPSTRPPSGAPVAPGSFSSGPAAGVHTPMPQAPLPGVPRGGAPAIVEAQGGVPVVADMTTEESVATLAMPRAQIGKPQPSGNMPRLEPRLDSAAASIGGAQSISVVGTRGVGPGGTQLVMVQRGNAPAPQAKSRPDDPTLSEEKSGQLKAHPAGYYIPPAVAATLGRGSAPQQAPQAPQQQLGAPPMAAPPQGVPRLYEEPSGPPQGSGEVATQIYRPGDTASRIKADAIPAPPAPPKQSVPLFMVLFGFLVIGFALVAGAIWLFKH
ncbi:Serine/threonine-protein kinase pkn2 [Minicystis rosea]|nr:Serine/threonine-protein kinase pkn2 [Minicystis rosea]